MRPNPTAHVALVVAPWALRSSQAITLDVIDVANRVSVAMGAPPPFALHALHPGDPLPPAISAVVMPGTGAGAWPELQAQLDTDAGAWVQRTLATAAAAGAYVATSCSAVSFAAAAGLLDGRAATTAWFLAPEFPRRFPAVQLAAERVLVESGRVLTGGAALAHADLMLLLVERLAGPALADLCAQYLLLDRRRSQRAYLVVQALLAGEPRLAAAERYVHDHLHATFTIGALASAVGMGERSFARLVQRTCGCAPRQLVQQMRVNAAQALLREGQSIDAIAPQVGYADGTALRRVLRKHAGGPGRLGPR